MNNSLIAPIILPFLTALILVLWRKPSTARRIFAFLMSVIILGVNFALTTLCWDFGITVLKIGGWQPPFGITLAVDLLSAIMLCLSGFLALCCVLYGFASQVQERENPLRLPLFFFLLAGIHMSFCTGDLFNLFVSFEVMLISSYALMTLEADNWHSKHAFSYVTINLFGSTLFLCALGLTYGLLGTLNYADIARQAANHINDPRLMLIGVMYTVVFSIKAGMFPLYYWLPNSYPTIPYSLSAFYGGMLTKVGIFVLLRLFCTILPHSLEPLHWIVLILAVPTMIFGVMGAMSKGFIRGILSYHIISQVGFMLLALGLFTPLGIAACIFYIMHHIIVKASLFLIGGVASRLNGTDSLKSMGNLWQKAPLLGVLFLIQALSLAGLPPLSGFWGKYLIIVVAIKEHLWVFAAVCIIASVFTLISMLKIWLAAFWHTSENVKTNLQDKRWIPMTLVIALMTSVSLFIGFNAELFMQIAQKAAEISLDQQGYIQKVLSL